VLSAVVIISNDGVIPYDVTTKDDLFYEVSCDYGANSNSELREGVLVKGGIVVGYVRRERAYTYPRTQRSYAARRRVVGRQETA